jgi:hypothetical protein
MSAIQPVLMSQVRESAIGRKKAIDGYRKSSIHPTTWSLRH